MSELRMTKILIVEDNEMNMELIVDILDDQYELLQARTAIHGLELAQNMAPDLILMDIAMPGLDGEEATRRLKANPKTVDIPVLVLTAHALPQDKARMIGLGAVDFITKPIDIMILLTVIEKTIFQIKGNQ
jgi:CheY-like chemotaxis protein